MDSRDEGHPHVPNLGSAARDYLARERNTLQYLKLCVNMVVVAAAFILKLKLSTTSDIRSGASLNSLENSYALPMGILFFVFAFLTCFNAVLEYFQLQHKMNRQLGFVQANAVSQTFWVVLCSLVGAGTICILVSQN